MPRQRKRQSTKQVESYAEWAARIDSEVEAAACALKPIDPPMPPRAVFITSAHSRMATF